MMCPVCTIEEIEKRDPSSCLLVDVREPLEIEETGVLDMGIQVLTIPLHHLLDLCKNLPNDWWSEKRIIVVYCRTGHRSQTGAEALNRWGLHAYSLQGGMFEWLRSKRSKRNRT